MNKTKRTIIIAVAAVFCAVAVIFGGILGVSRYIYRDEVAAEKAEKERIAASENQTDEAVSETESSQYVVIPNAEDGSVQFGGEELFNEKAKNNVITPEEAAKGSSGQAGQSKSSSSSSSDSSSGNTSSDNKSSSGSSQASNAPYALSSNDISEVLAYYKKVSNLNASKQFHKSLTLVSMNGGETVKQSWVDNFRGMAEKGLAKNNIDNEPYPGKPNQIMASDWRSARAVNDGKYTTLTINVVPQTDNANGSQFAGTCGRSMGVLDGMQRALQDLPLVSIESMDMEINYQNPVIKLKVDNQTGQLVKGGCSWSYRTNIKIKRLKGRAIVNITLKNASGAVDYRVSY